MDNLKVIVLIPTRVRSLKEHGSPVAGWYANFEGSSESLLVGATKPDDLNVGDSVYIAILKPRS